MHSHWDFLFALSRSLTSLDLSQNNLVRGSKRAEHASEDADRDEFFGSSMGGIIKLFEALLTHP